MDARGVILKLEINASDYPYAVVDPGGVRRVQSNPPLAHSLVWKIPIWTFTFAQKYLSGNLRTPPRTPFTESWIRPSYETLRAQASVSECDDNHGLMRHGTISWSNHLKPVGDVVEDVTLIGRLISQMRQNSGLEHCRHKHLGYLQLTKLLAKP